MVRAYMSLASRWMDILLGRSRYHVAQPLGRYFQRTRVAGYYNDLTRKADWPGETDAEGIPFDSRKDGKPMYYPVTISQMALGTYDRWLAAGHARDRGTFQRLAQWLLDHQDDNGGWYNPWTYVGERSLSNYSAMAQGEAISVFVRAFTVTEDPSYLEGARRAYQLMVAPITEGGCAYYDDRRITLEEYPESPPNSVLNGWIFAMFGVYDLMLATNDGGMRDTFHRSLKTLADSLDAYDLGFWSRYDLRGHIASPFYHVLHSALLDALHALTGVEALRATSDRWKGYRRSWMNRSRALGIKVVQKIKDPIGPVLP